MYADGSDRVPSDRNLPSTSKDEDETGNGDADSTAKRVIAKAFRILVQYMDPNPIFDCALESDVFTFKQIRDMKENVNTLQENRSLCHNISQRGRIGYDKLKDWLGQTDQKELVEVLDCIEGGEDYTKHLETLHEKMKHKMKKGNQKDEAYGEMKSEIRRLGQNLEDPRKGDVYQNTEDTREGDVYQNTEEPREGDIYQNTEDPREDDVYQNTEDQKEGDVYQNTEDSREGSAVPDELASDPRTLELYETAIREGEERDSNIRVMVVGCFGQGKSSLVRHLTGQSLEGVESTNGIEVQICERTVDTQELWAFKYSRDTGADILKRLVTVASLMQNQPLEKTEHISAVSSGTSDTLVAQRTTTLYDRLAQPSKTKDSLEFVEEIKKNKEKENNLQEKPLEINIWDFGGQFVFYATHQLFHSRQAIYILVFDISKELDVKVYDEECPNEDRGKSMKEYLKFWIGSVHSFVGNEDGTEPPIFLVGTHLDMLDKHTDQEKRFGDVRDLFDDDLCAFHIQPEQFAVSNTNPNHAKFADIRRAVTAYALKKSAGLFIPAKWIPLERSLKENRHLKIITFEKVKEFDKSNDIPIASEDQLKLFLQYHHEKGTFFYFENKSDAENYIVLDPQFLIDAFRCIITADKFCCVHPNLRKLWRKLRNEAVLEKELLDEIWKKESDKEFIRFKKPLLFFLQKHRIIAEALAFKEDPSTPVPQNFYIVPSLLKNTSERMIDDFLKGKRYTNVSIGYNFKYASTLCTVYNRVIASALGRWPILKFKSTSLVYENAVVCKLNLSHSGILKKLNNSIELLVVSLCPAENVSIRDCDAFRRFVEMVIQEELHKFQTNDFQNPCRGYSEIVRCYDKDHGYSGSCDKYELDTLRTCNKDIIGCPDHLNHFIAIQDIMTEWFNADIAETDVPKRTLTEFELSKLSLSIGNNWKHLARMLGFSNAVIDHVCTDKHTTATRIYEILRRWRAEQLDCATLDVLISAILECGESLTVNSDTLKNLIDGTWLIKQY